MSRTTRPSRSLLGLTAVAVMASLIALPSYAAEPSPSPAAEETGKPDKSPKPGKAAKAEKGPKVEVTISGTVATRTNAAGELEYTLTTGGKTYILDGGPPWFYGNDHPLEAFVGDSVTIAGSTRGSETEVDIDTVNGARLREPGKPLWAGGWKRAGARHPGWSQEKIDRWQAKAAAKMEALGVDCFPPGQCKDKPGKRGASPDTEPESGGN